MLHITIHLIYWQVQFFFKELSQVHWKHYTLCQWSLSVAFIAPVMASECCFCDHVPFEGEISGMTSVR